MRLHIAALAAFALPSFFATTVGAACCSQSGGISGYCDDGTRATPCCGKGSCNLFCCNCDGGCRQGGYVGCVQAAANVQTACLIASFLVPGASAVCNAAYAVAVAACPKEPKAKRDPYSDLALIERDPTSACSMGNVFQLSDMDQSGNITVDEYLMFANWTSKGMLNTPEDFVPWVSYFHSFDTDGDGYIVSSEYERS